MCSSTDEGRLVVNEPETIDYLTDDVADTMSHVEQHLTVITVAEEYGFHMTNDDYIACQISEMKPGMLVGVNSPYPYSGDALTDISDLATEATEYLTDNGIVPRAYDHGQKDTRAGWGTARGGGAARQYGAAWVVGI